MIGHQDPIIRTCHRELKVISHCVLWLHKTHRGSQEPQQSSHQADLWSEIFQRWELPTRILISERTVKINTVEHKRSPQCHLGQGMGWGGATLVHCLKVDRYLPRCLSQSFPKASLLRSHPGQRLQVSRAPTVSARRIHGSSERCQNHLAPCSDKLRPQKVSLSKPEVAHVSNPSTLEAEAGNQGYKTNLGYTKS